ncbi:MAG: transglutaminase-like domain-containing protein [Acidobacteriota bacterium]|nr:transglutaminase-like domain-containing protein [Acidobacteriota bacterium]
MIENTLRAMRQMVEKAKEDFGFVSFARELVEHVPGHDFFGEVNEIFKFCRDKIRYVRDPYGIELVQSPQRTLQLGYGDCDDKTVLFCALCESIGHRTRFVLESMNGKRWNHVRADVFLFGKWIPADCTPEASELGWAAKTVKKRKPVTNIEVVNLNDLGFFKKAGRALKKASKGLAKGVKKSRVIKLIPAVGPALQSAIDSIPKNKNLEKKCSKAKNLNKPECIQYRTQIEKIEKEGEIQKKQTELLEKLASRDNNITMFVIGGIIILLLVVRK